MHIPVMLNEVLDFLKLKNGSIIIDATFGAGGHAKSIAKKIGANGRVIAFEKDEESFEAGKILVKKYPNIILFNESYINLKLVLNNLNIKRVDGILFDFGVSSMQIDDGSRGFSFNKSGPLDMRFSKFQTLTAEYIINNYSQDELSSIFFKYGEERFSKRIARTICKERTKKRIVNTLELSRLIGKTALKRERINPATRVFQALRIETNDELNSINKAIRDSLDVISPGGRFCAISFHSLEDRIVKQIFRELSIDCICPKGLGVCVCNNKPKIKVVGRLVRPSENEIEKNKRAKSAKLRVAEVL